MNSTQSLKSEAKKLMAELAKRGNTLKFQDALDIIAVLHNHRSWQHAAPTAKAADKATSVKAVPASLVTGLPEMDDAFAQQAIPGSGWLYRVPVSAEYTKTAVVAVRATNVDEALLLARELAADGKVTLLEDEGNPKDVDAFYIPDESSDGVYKLPPSNVAASVNTWLGAQVGPYLVEFEALGHSEYVACLAFFDQTQEDGVALRHLSGIPLGAAEATRVEACRRIAQGLFDKAPTGFESPEALDMAFLQLLN